MRYYTKTHEWIEWIDEKTATFGITNHAQKALGDIVHIELPTKGEAYSKEAPLAAVESVKAASDVYAPEALEVIKINSLLTTNPETINEDAENKGWICQVHISKDAIKTLLTQEDYIAFTQENCD